MRFINTRALRLEMVADTDLQDAEKYPKGYAILSHRWGPAEREVSFSDMQKSEHDEFGMDEAGWTEHHARWVKQYCDSPENRADWAKLIGACKLSLSLGYELLWIDTCCIDKRNSVELAEAINSMYRWYAEADLCIGYLEDVGRDRRDFTASEWFSRGWTLQELIAPKEVSFYDYKWAHIKDRSRLAKTIQSLTGIPEEVLLHRQSIRDCSIAQRMSWASRRETSRIEDQAYCLMGIFEINMPMIYGEREKAFVRLQEEIVKKSNDHSIFIWEDEPLTNSMRQNSYGLLAPSPICFLSSGEIVRAKSQNTYGFGQLGLSISLQSQRIGPDTYVVAVADSFPASKNRPYKELACVLLQRLPETDQYVRIRFPEGHSLQRQSARSWSMKRQQFHVVQDLVTDVPITFPGLQIKIRGVPITSDGPYQILSCRKSDQIDRILLAYGADDLGTAGIIKCDLLGGIKDSELGSFADICRFAWMRFGFDEDSNPMCLIVYDNNANKLDPAVRIDEKEFDALYAARQAGKESSMRDSFWNRWLDVDAGGQMLKYHIWRVDRKSKLDFQLQSRIELNASISLEKDPMASLGMPRLIWTVDFEKWPISDRVKAHKHLGRAPADEPPESADEKATEKPLPQPEDKKTFDLGRFFSPFRDRGRIELQ